MATNTSTAAKMTDTFCLGIVHDKCNTCAHAKRWDKLNDLPNEERRSRQERMGQIDSLRCRLTKMGAYQNAN